MTGVQTCALPISACLLHVRLAARVGGLRGTIAWQVLDVRREAEEGGVVVNASARAPRFTVDAALGIADVPAERRASAPGWACHSQRPRADGQHATEREEEWNPGNMGTIYEGLVVKQGPDGGPGGG